MTLAQQIVQTVVLMAFFLPFSYFMDSMIWRSYQRRLARQRWSAGARSARPLAAAVVALAGPRREQQQDRGRPRRSRPSAARPGRSGRACRASASTDSPPARIRTLALEHGHPGVLLHLVVAELLARVEHDQHRAGLVAGVDDDRIARAGRRLDLHQVPGLHGRARIDSSASWRSRSTQLSLGQIGTNCYLVRADRGATEAVVVDPGADAAEIRLALARSGATCAAILLTHSHYDHFGALADLAEGTGAPVWLPEGELDVFRRPERLLPGPRRSAPTTGEATLLAGGETVEAAGISFQVTPRARALAGPPRLLRRRLPLLRRRALRRLGRPHRPAVRRLGRRCSSRSARLAERLSARDGRLLRATARRRRSAHELARNPFLAELRAS